MLAVKGIRGAISVEENTGEAILKATKELIQEIWNANGLHQEKIISILFTMTPDLNAEFPAKGARELGLAHIPLMCAQEIPVPGSLPRCIRALIHINSEEKQQMNHVYLGEATKLRPDLV